MPTLVRELAGLRIAAALAVVLALSAVPAAHGAPAASTKAKRESYPALQQQVASGQVRQATVSTKTHTVKVRLKNGAKFAANYPAGADPTASLRAHGAHVRAAAHKAKASSHIRTRYVVLGAAVVLLLAGGLCYLVWRRRSTSGPAVDAGEPAG